jgi:UDP-glucose 4-epimerase
MERKMRVLVTGGSGYIGSHTCVQLLQNGHDVIILDNLCNSKRSVLPVIERLGGKQPSFVEGDIRNEALMTEILHDHAIDTVIHFAGLKAVGESVAKPLEYYDNNVNGTLRLISAMRAAGVKNFIFSSSATVYGDQPKIPYVESFPDVFTPGTKTKGAEARVLQRHVTCEGKTIFPPTWSANKIVHEVGEIALYGGRNVRRCLDRTRRWGGKKCPTCRGGRAGNRAGRHV